MLFDLDSLSPQFPQTKQKNLKMTKKKSRDYMTE